MSESDHIFHFNAITRPSILVNAAAGSSRPVPPTYEEVMAEAENTSRFTHSPVAPDHSSIDFDETKPLLPVTREGLKTNEPSSSTDIPGQTDVPLSSPPVYTLSDATFERTQQGITSYDEKLNKELESLFRFFQAHNDKPEMAVSIHGFHDEHRVQNDTYIDENGQSRTRTTSSTEQVTDFMLNFDVTEFISPLGNIIAVPTRGQPAQQIEQLLEEYISHPNQLKEIEMRKVVDWDYESISTAITAAIRAQGFHKSLTISFPLRNHIVTVRANTRLSRLARNPFVIFMSVITCLWIILWPLSWCYKKSFKNKLKSEFQMTISPGRWFNQNIQTIVGTVRWL